MKCQVQNSLNYESANDLLLKLQTVLNLNVFEAIFFCVWQKILVMLLAWNSKTIETNGLYHCLLTF